MSSSDPTPGGAPAPAEPLPGASGPGASGPGRLGAVFVLLTVVLDAAGMGLIMPVMPELLREFSVGGELSGAAVIGGWLAFSYAFAQFLCAPVIGALSDAHGRRPVLLISMAAMSLDYVLLATTGALWVLILARLLSGAAGATMTPARAWLADQSRPEDRGKAFGRIGAAFGLGFVLGPALGGLLGEYGPRAPIWAAAAIAGVNFVFGWFVLSESLPPALRRPFEWAAVDPTRALRRAAKLPNIGLLMLAYLLYDFALYAYPSVWTFVASASWNWGATEIGVSLAGYGLFAGLSMAFLIGPATRALGTTRLVVIALAVEAALAVCVATFSAGWAVFALLPLLGATAIAGPALEGMISASAPADRQGEISGVIAALTSVAAILSPPMMTAVFAAATSGPGPHMPGAPFLLSALIALLGLGAFLVGLRRARRKGPPGAAAA
ncbi:MFS transporter [Rhodovulum sp. DZ06]|uniref:MFS transporter n=1 Tax=Rhodovulum sp. DZ06 TaxID=3425126 RepID=UPI003D338187